MRSANGDIFASICRGCLPKMPHGTSLGGTGVPTDRGGGRQVPVPDDFTRFVPPEQAAEMPRKWPDYYQKWWMMTGKHLPKANSSDLGCKVARASLINSPVRSETSLSVITGGGETGCLRFAAYASGVDVPI